MFMSRIVFLIGPKETGYIFSAFKPPLKYWKAGMAEDTGRGVVDWMILHNLDIPCATIATKLFNVFFVCVMLLSFTFSCCSFCLLLVISIRFVSYYSSIAIAQAKLKEK